MKTVFIFISLVFCINCFSCKNQNSFGAFDFIPNSTKEAEARGFVKINSDLLQDLSAQEPSIISSIYQLQKGDTLLKFFFADEKLYRRSLFFPLKRFDSSELFINLRKIGELILNEKRDETALMGAFKRESDVFLILESAEGIALTNRPGVDKATRSTGPIIEPPQKH